MRGIALGVEIAATCAAWSLVGGLLGKYLSASWPLVVFSLVGVVHSLYGFVKSASRKS
jgi:hypothetical protein